MAVPRVISMKNEVKHTGKVDYSIVCYGKTDIMIVEEGPEHGADFAKLREIKTFTLKGFYYQQDQNRYL